MAKVPALLMNEGSVSDKKFQVPDLGAVHRRIVDLVHDPVGEGVPEV